VTIPGRIGDQVRFAEAVGATRLSDGRIAIADGPEGTIRFFTSAGIPAGSAGRWGRGPGEFQQISGLGRCRGDTLVVLETFSRRVTLLTGSGAEVRRLEALLPLQLACSGQGRLAALRPPQQKPAPEGGIRTLLAPVVIADGTGRVLKELGDLPAMEIALLDGQWTPRPLGPATTLAAGGGRIYVGSPDSARVLVFSDSGRRLPPVGVTSSRRRPTEAQVHAAIAAMVWPVPEGVREPLGKKFRRIPLPPVLPAYHAVFATATGALWIQTSFPGDAETAFEVFDTKGQRLGRANLPFAARVFEVEDGYLIAGVEDEEGEPAVAMYRITR